MKVFILSVLIIFCLSCSNKKETENIVISESNAVYLIPDAPRWVDDSEYLFSKNEIQILNNFCDSIYSNIEFFPMIHTTSTFGTFNSFNDYASAVDNIWADKSNKYFIIIISSSLMEIRIINGETTDKKLPANFTNKLLDEIIYPNFRNNNYFEGVYRSLKEYYLFLSSQ